MEFSAQRLHKFLAGKLPEEFGAPDSELKLSQFQHGQSNPTYLLESQGRQYVLRKKPTGTLLPSAHAIEREFMILRALSSTAVPVPRPLLLCEDPEVIGTPFFIMEYARGRIFTNPLLPEIPGDQRKHIYQSMAETLAKIHNVDWVALGLSSFGRVGEFSKRQVLRWTQQYKASSTGVMPVMDELIQWLSSNVPSESGTVITHGDYRLDNLVFHPTSPRVIAVLDWELSTLGHPMSDLAYNCMQFVLPPTFKAYRGLQGVELTSLRIPSLPEYVAMYSRLSDSPVDPQRWSFYMALSCFRGAAILQGVFKRSLQGNASAANARQVGAVAEQMASTGLAIAKGPPLLPPLPSSPNSISTTTSRASIFQMSPRGSQLLREVEDFMAQYVIPREERYWQQVEAQGFHPQQRWRTPEVMEELKRIAKDAGLWNLWLPLGSKYGPGLSNLDYAPIAEAMGRSVIASEVFNCNAPDTGNMEVLLHYGSEEQQRRWLVPLLDGSLRSCFAMTEPTVASSDATNMQTTITRDGEHYIVNGRKWWSTGAGNERCGVAIVMGRSDGSAPRHRQHSMVIVPMDAPGVKLVRHLTVLGYNEAPHGHPELLFDQVRVPASHIVLGEGRGFEIAQGRLGPGRVHHCMRLIGLAERCQDQMCRRVQQRTAFGKKLAQQGTILADIARSRAEIEQARLLVLRCADVMDRAGNKAAARDVSLIKAVVPSMACGVIDRAIQAHGGAGLSSDFVLAGAYAHARALRIADGPDEVHRESVAKLELSRCKL